MKLQILALCDAANTDTNGKLNILGIYDEIRAKNEPIEHVTSYVVVKLQFDKDEIGTKLLQIGIVDSKGEDALPPLRGQVEVRDSPTGGTVQLIASVQQLKLPHFGEYRIVVLIDGNIVGSTRLIAAQAEKSQSYG